MASPLRRYRAPVRNADCGSFMGNLGEQKAFNLTSLRCAAGTDVGMRRDENQDCFGIFKGDLFTGYFVADGMGGVHGGATASRLAISTLEDLLAKSVGVTPDGLIAIAREANTRIFEKGSKDPTLAGMGTTLVGLVFNPEGLMCLNVGDSRAYRVRGNSIQQLSEDHTLVRELVRSGAIDLEEAERHPVSHMLTRSLGPVPEVQIEARFLNEQPELGDIYILCSDGLYNLVSEPEMLGVVRQNPLDDANQILINLANQRGGPDNVTVLVISVGERMGRGRSQAYRTARDSAASLSQESTHTDLPEQEGRDVQGTAEAEERESRPPPVEEPRDQREHKRKLMADRKRAAPPSRGIPVPLLVVAALLLGLTAGDMARRFGVNLGSFSFQGSAGNNASPPGAQPLTELSQNLDIKPGSASAEGGLPEIARQFDISRYGDAAAKGFDVDGLSSSRVVLQRAVAGLEQQLALLSSPVGPENETQLQVAKARLSQITKDYEELQIKVATASHGLAQWSARRAKLDEPGADIFKSANQLKAAGACPDSTQRKLDRIAEVSNKFQEIEGSVEVSPDDSQLERSLQEKNLELVRLRSELLVELRGLYDRVLLKVNTESENLKMQRDTLTAQKQATESEIVLREALASGDPIRRSTLRASLERQLEDTRATLAALQNRGR